MFNDLSSLSEWTESESSEDKQDSNSGPDEVAPDDSDTSTPPSPRLAPSSLGGPTAPKKRGNSVGARIVTLTMFDDASQAEKLPDFKAIRTKTSVTRSSVYKLRSKAISRG